MKNKAKHQRKSYRSPRTTQERRNNGRRSKWERAKQSKTNLINWWDDKHHIIQKTWKVKRRHQYRDTSRGKKHFIFLPGRLFRSNTWKLERYFIEKDIPYHIKRIHSKNLPVYIISFQYPNWIMVLRYRSKFLGYELAWWSDKDIGIDFILSRTANINK